MKPQEGEWYTTPRTTDTHHQFYHTTRHRLRRRAVYPLYTPQEWDDRHLRHANTHRPTTDHARHHTLTNPTPTRTPDNDGDIAEFALGIRGVPPELRRRFGGIPAYQAVYRWYTSEAGDSSRASCMRSLALPRRTKGTFRVEPVRDTWVVQSLGVITRHRSPSNDRPLSTWATQWTPSPGPVIRANRCVVDSRRHCRGMTWQSRTLLLSILVLVPVGPTLYHG